jgi:Carbohydrate-selective porin, OprB family/S-layer homology domain
MSLRLLSALWLTPVLLGATVVAAKADQPVTAETMNQVITYTENTGTTRIGQVTSVSQLSDVKPTDWAFQSLQSLVERYGCIAGYPDKTYRGNRAMTRYEFAAGLNACMDRVNELIAAGTADLVKKDDLDTLKRLQEEFRAELDELRGKIDGLEVRTATLEKQQFSTTTKLNGEAIFGLAGVLGGDTALNSDQRRAGTTASPELQDNTIFGNRVRLHFDTSFSGKDRLRARLQARNLTTFAGGVTGTNETRLSFDNTNNNVFGLSRLEYRFPIGSQITAYIGGGNDDGLNYYDMIPTLSPFSSSGSGAISRFGRFSPIFRINQGTGIAANIKLGKEFTFGEKFTLSLGYLVPTADAVLPSEDRGLFNGDQSALAQLVFQPTPNIGVGFTYAHGFYTNAFNLTGSTGTGFASNPFNGIDTEANSFGVQAQVKLNPGIILAGWVNYIDATATANGAGTAATRTVRNGDSADIWSWSVGLAFPDLGKQGNLAGIIFGAPPTVTDSDFGVAAPTATSAQREDDDTTYHLEAFYRWKFTDNLAITPGFFVIFNPQGNENNDTTYVGAIRATFSF